MPVRNDFRQRLTNALIENIEEHNGFPWEYGQSSMSVRPFNPATGVRYKGGNIFNLVLEQIHRGSDDPRWMTLKQANNAGYSIRKGAKAAYVEYWDWGQSQAPHGEDEDEQGKLLSHDDTGQEPRHKPRLFFATVFNGRDIVGLPEIKQKISWQPNELVEKLITATGAEIEHTTIRHASHGVVENVANYHHGQDKIFVPPRNSFKNEGQYHASVLHELAHWAGHHSRLARRAPAEKHSFDSPEHAQEALRVEIATMFLNSMVGVKDRIQNHAKYTERWLEILKGDKHEIFRAARDAEKIVDHIFGYVPELREVVETGVTDNLLPKEPQRKLDSGISQDLPDFIPPQETVQVPAGRDDPRWAAFDHTVRGEARKFGVDDAVVDNALNLIEPQFTEMMNASDDTADDMNAMFAQRISDEMRTADIRQQQWDRFCDQIHQTGANLYPVEQIELALQALGNRYQQLIVKSTQERWTKAQTDTEIRFMIFGEEGRRPITGEYVKAFIENSPTAQHVTTGADNDDDFMLMPLGLSGTMTGDSGMVVDERSNGTERYIMDDAEIHA